MRRKILFLPLALAVVVAVSMIALRFHTPEERRSVTLYSVGDMIDPNVLDSFTDETGIAVRYLRLEQGQSAKLSECDVLLTELPFLELLDAQGQLTMLDRERLPVSIQLVPSYLNAVRRNTHAAAIPALWTTMGLLHDSAASGTMVRSWADLFDTNYPGTIAITGIDQKALACAMLAKGYPITTTRPEACLDATLTLKQLSALVTDFSAIGSLGEGFRSGRVSLAPCYAGEAVKLMAEMPQLSFVFPIEGSWQTVLGYAMPRQCVDQDSAYALLNYLCRPYIMARNAVYSGWSTPSLDAWRLLSTAWQRNPLAYGKSGLAVAVETPILDFKTGRYALVLP